MARRRHEEEHENHERWLVSYADFITLLFAFFVVMYAISSVNEGKYRVLSDALEAAFRAPPRSMEPIQVGRLARLALEPDALVALPPLPPPALGGDPGGELAGREGLPRVAHEVTRALRPLVDMGLVRVRRRPDGVHIEVASGVLFPSGSARLTPEAMPVLERLAQVLRTVPNPVRVEGHTDNVPIRTTLYPSNWELSAARAASVVRLFERLGVDPGRLIAVGYGEHRPVADNATPEGRRRNRRVVVVVLAEGTEEARRALPPDAPVRTAPPREGRP